MNITDFDIIFRVNEDEYGVGMVYPDEDNSTEKTQYFVLWAAHPEWLPEEVSYHDFCFDYVHDAYVWEKLTDTKQCVDEFVKYWSLDPKDFPNIKHYKTIEEIVKTLQVGQFAILDL